MWYTLYCWQFICMSYINLPCGLLPTEPCWQLSLTVYRYIKKNSCITWVNDTFHKFALRCIFSHAIFFFLLKRPPPESLKCLTPPLPWESDEFLQPILPNDGLLQYGMSFFLLLYLKGLGCSSLIFVVSNWWKRNTFCWENHGHITNVDGFQHLNHIIQLMRSYV